jgi:formylglycine-generating enzyme required for sulfatase activity
LGVEIARGGMGAVYRATDTAFEREVAVKVLLDRFAPTSGTARRFHDEARITGQLQHPNIPAVHDLGTLPDGRPFLAMKLIKGETLDDLLKARENPGADRGRFVAAFEQVCQALAYAHAHNVIHRDLKPANVMVGSFGEVQVMDWGLAKVLGAREAERTDPEETASPTAIHSIRESDSAFTQAGSVLGTPAYMPPEQAIGAIHKVDARSDVFGLGAILAVILTGKPPFLASSVETTRLQAAQGNVEECYTRLDASGAEPELVLLCKRCLSKKPGDRPADAGEVAKSVAELRAAADERARQAELDRVKAEGEKATAEAKAEEQRKRRRVQLALAGFVVVVAVGGGVVASWVQSQQAADRLAAEQKQVAAQRQTRAELLVQSLATAETTVVPRIVAELADLRDLARPKLIELASQPVTTKPGLHARLALVVDEPGCATDLVAYLPGCQPEELLTIREFLKPHLAVVSPGLWSVAQDEKADSGERKGARVRAACALAGLVPDDPRWAKLIPVVIEAVFHASPVEFVVWSQALEPVRGALLPALVKRYPESRARIRSGKLDELDLVTEVLGFDLTVNLLAKYAADRPANLADLAMTVDPRHYKLISEAIEANQAAVIPILKAELAKTAGPDWKGDAVESLGVRQANAAAALLKLKQPDLVWPLFQHRPDPRVRSYLIHRLSPLGADPRAIVKRLDEETEISARRALLLCLGEYDEKEFTADDRKAFLPKLQELYRKASDPGLHASAEWLLRTWKQEAWLKQVNEEWAKDEDQQGERLEGIGKLLTKDKEKTPPQWYVNTQGQTMVVIPGPVEFTMGSPPTEAGRFTSETQHKKRIGRTFAIATKSVTVEEYRKFNARYGIGEIEGQARTADSPVIGTSWYQAVAYCNWLSKEEGIPEDQWCYEIKGNVTKLKEKYLSLTGYRLPTEAEMEYATRAGALTSRYYGETEELLSKYAWYDKNSQERTWPVGILKPNDLGLFDVQGNVSTWCQESFKGYPQGEEVSEDKEDALTIVNTNSRVLRGGSFLIQASNVRSSNRDYFVPSYRDNNIGFRLARTFIP